MYKIRNSVSTSSGGTVNDDVDVLIIEQDSDSTGKLLIAQDQASTPYFEIGKNGSMIKKTSDPCSSFEEGALFYNDTSDYFCFCNGSGDDVQFHSPTTACF